MGGIQEGQGPGGGTAGRGGNPPRYRTIADDLARRIREEEFRPGEALPAQRDLSAQYGVTLMTLRQALAGLQESGLVVQQAGRGTFVSAPVPAYRLDTLRSFAADLREQGHPVTTEVLSAAMRPVPAWAAERLALPRGDRALRLERLRVVSGRRAVHQESWVPEPWAQRVRGRDFARTSLYEALADAGVEVARASERVVGEDLPDAVARHLGVDAGRAAFRSERTTYDSGDVAVVVDRAWMLGSLLEVRTERARSAVSVSWGAVTP
ncbi:GntR family transcriptional regulator [Kineococcus xinjiangensis]|uniref:GntR family transcriptional regulator n=1 Tax=Kineococcus xinjiangensis TaxID=512762 RepID=A0A2S6IV12_9ACTN|nr:GntR family transcriptional regulator [Kineococcus xinjiangensis]PPK98101.1 GntR family transcriptional regulator [Kineococcus xinjiangensis]